MASAPFVKPAVFKYKTRSAKITGQMSSNFGQGVVHVRLKAGNIDIREKFTVDVRLEKHLVEYFGDFAKQLAGQLSGPMQWSPNK